MTCIIGWTTFWYKLQFTFIWTFQHEGDQDLLSIKVHNTFLYYQYLSIFSLNLWFYESGTFIIYSTNCRQARSRISWNLFWGHKVSWSRGLFDINDHELLYSVSRAPFGPMEVIRCRTWCVTHCTASFFCSLLYELQYGMIHCYHKKLTGFSFLFFLFERSFWCSGWNLICSLCLEVFLFLFLEACLGFVSFSRLLSSCCFILSFLVRKAPFQLRMHVNADLKKHFLRGIQMELNVGFHCIVWFFIFYFFWIRNKISVFKSKRPINGIQSEGGG